MSQPRYAISVKQPWAALLAAGVKTVEVRTWPTSRRGPLLIHASKIPDDRPHGWALVTTPELEALAALRGGVIGEAELADCRTYDSPAAFAAECALHRNSPDWFVPPRLYGFVFRSARVIEYHACNGKTMFFAVSGLSAGGREEPDRRETPVQEGLS